MLTTFMFVPAHDARKVGKALESAADAIILDLEDAVPEQMKGAARDAAARIVREHSGDGPQVWVRVNDARTPHYEADLRGIEWPRAGGLVIPKAEEARSLTPLARLGLRGLILTVESAAGFAQLDQMALAAAVKPRVAIGTWDLAHDLGLTVDDPDASELIWHLRCELVVASRKLRLQSPIDGVYGRIDDEASFERMANRAFHLGYGGKLLIHPMQIPLAARIFGISEAQLAEARELIDAYEQAQRAGIGAIRHRGQMVDRVHVQRARALLARSEQV